MGLRQSRPLAARALFFGESGGAPRLGLWYRGAWHSPAQALSGLAEDPLRAIESGAFEGQALDQLFQGCSKSSEMAEPKRFLCPLPRPRKILCLAKNFAKHAVEMGGAPSSEPRFFAKLPDVLLAPGEAVPIPGGVGRVDHEAELCLILGRGGKRLSPEEALGLVRFVSILDDVTAREIQKQDRESGHPWLRSKNYDGFAPFGPWLVPFEDLFEGEIPAHGTPDLALELRVDGELRQSSRTSCMIHGVANTVSYLSQHITLHAGDVIAMGTPEGVGPLQAGNEVEIFLEGVGHLRHGVRAEDS